MARELKPCPFCGDPMEWNHDVDGFMHTPRSTDIGKCYLRHTYYHRGQLDWWNTRADQPPPNTDLTDVERVARALCRVTRVDPDAPHLDGNPRWLGWTQFAEAAIAAMPQQPVHADEDELGDGSDFGVTGEWWGQTNVERVARAIMEAQPYNLSPDEAMNCARAALLVSNRSGEGRQDFSRLTLRHNIETILRQWRDAHPNTLLDKIMSAIPRVSNRSEVEEGVTYKRGYGPGDGNSFIEQALNTEKEK